MRIRKLNAVVFACSLVAAGYLGFAEISLQQDKLAHFAVFMVLTAQFYWCFDSASTRALRNVTVMVCCVGGGVLSEFVQGLLPYRTFDPVDILCNVAGSGLAVVASVYYHKRLLEAKRQLRYEQLRQSIPDVRDGFSGNEEDVDFEMGGANSVDLSKYSSREDLTLKTIRPEPIDDLQVD